MFSSATVNMETCISQENIQKNMITTVQNGKQSIRTKTTNVIARQIRRTRPDLYRLASFRTWKDNTLSIISPVVLAKVGFSYTGKDDRVKCESCNLEIDSWKSGMDPKQEHMERSPQCSFVLNQQELFSRNDQIGINAKSSITLQHIQNSDTRGYMDHGGGDDNETINRTREIQFISILSNDTLDRARTYTFCNWPSITPSAEEMACAGWWYTNISDRVICIHCDAMFHSWTENDKPYEIHRLKSPRCYYVRMKEETQSNRTTTNQVSLPEANTTLTQIPNGQSIVGAIHANYAQIFNRRDTFKSWPEKQPKNYPSIDSFVEAGFFYTGDKTVVRCFYCNGALRNWESTDDPKVEHARWFAGCSYIRQFIGENLYQAIQRKNREIRAQQNLQNSNSESSEIFPWTNDEIDRMVKARLDLPVVEKLRQEGYSMAIIRKVYEMQLRFKKDDFKTDVDLRVACLVLDKQVKLINGNEANILIPQNWIKKYLEDQARGTTDPPKPDIKPSLTTETQKIEVPKIVNSIVPRPRVLPKTQSDEQNVCVLCLTTERQVACLPCGHLTSCVACGHSLKTCPICRAAVKAFVRIYT